eukprot:6187971-Pleurochrysis_carterae.AAC.1
MVMMLPLLMMMVVMVVLLKTDRGSTRLAATAGANVVLAPMCGFGAIVTLARTWLGAKVPWRERGLARVILRANRCARAPLSALGASALAPLPAPRLSLPSCFGYATRRLLGASERVSSGLGDLAGQPSARKPISSAGLFTAFDFRYVAAVLLAFPAYFRALLQSCRGRTKVRDFSMRRPDLQICRPALTKQTSEQAVSRNLREYRRCACTGQHVSCEVYDGETHLYSPSADFATSVFAAAAVLSISQNTILADAEPKIRCQLSCFAPAVTRISSHVSCCRFVGARDMVCHLDIVDHSTRMIVFSEIENCAPAPRRTE